MRLSKQGNDALPDKIQPGEGSDGISNRQTQGPVRVCVEKWENLFGTKTHLEGEIGGSPSQRKHLRTSSLSSLVPPHNRNSPGPTFARTFQESSPPAPATRPTVNKSASECNLAQWVGRSSVKDLTISTLIAECEEYVQTDKFTKDLSHELVTLFKAEKPTIATSPPAQRASPKVVADPAPMPPGGGQADGRPPRIPDTMRTRSSPKTGPERKDRHSEVPPDLARKHV